MEISFLVVLDRSWTLYYEVRKAHFAAQGYPTLETSPGLMFDRVSYLYEEQFGIKITMARVHAFPALTEACKTNEKYADSSNTGAQDSSNTFKALADAGISTSSAEAGVARLVWGPQTA